MTSYNNLLTTLLFPSTGTGTTSTSRARHDIRLLEMEYAPNYPELSSCSVFDSFGVLEHILSYLDVDTVLSATLVNRRWKEASRHDEIWREFGKKLWEGKKGAHAVTDSLFWKSLYTNDAVSRMSEVQIRSIFEHPLLVEQRNKICECNDMTELRRFLQVHMLDVWSEDKDETRQLFFSDLYFGSYACSLMDSKRVKMTQAELCAKRGYQMFFEILEEDVEVTDRRHFKPYKDGILLIPYRSAVFEESREFRIDHNSNPDSFLPATLRWTWIEIGRQVQVGPYPPLIASRSDDWGWKLENLHVVLFARDP
jgi:F-box-like